MFSARNGILRKLCSRVIIANLSPENSLTSAPLNTPNGAYPLYRESGVNIRWGGNAPRPRPAEARTRSVGGRSISTPNVFQFQLNSAAYRVKSNSLSPTCGEDRSIENSMALRDTKSSGAAGAPKRRSSRSARSAPSPAGGLMRYSDDLEKRLKSDRLTMENSCSARKLAVASRRRPG